jgi:hypothetical protein
LTIYPKKRYIIIDLTKYIPTEATSPENQWIELFRNLPTAKAVPRGIDKVVRAVYRQLLVKKATETFITEVATGMVDKDEFNACMSYARREGYEEGEAKGEAKGEARAKRKFAARDKKIAEYFRSIGVPKKHIETAMAIR